MNCPTAKPASSLGTARHPHSGFPDWRPSADSQEFLDEALVWACNSGRTEALPRLVRAGARLDADPFRGTPLIWEAVCNRIETAEWLIDHGATINLKTTFGGLTRGQGVTALHMASQRGHVPMARLLIQCRGGSRVLWTDGGYRLFEVARKLRL